MEVGWGSRDRAVDGSRFCVPQRELSINYIILGPRSSAQEMPTYPTNYTSGSPFRHVPVCQAESAWQPVGTYSPHHPIHKTLHSLTRPPSQILMQKPQMQHVSKPHQATHIYLIDARRTSGRARVVMFCRDGSSRSEICPCTRA